MKNGKHESNIPFQREAKRSSALCRFMSVLRQFVPSGGDGKKSNTLKNHNLEKRIQKKTANVQKRFVLNTSTLEHE